MNVLAIETSCDETAAAVVALDRGRFAVRSNIVASQAAKHAEWGGVVPELATREHLAALEPVCLEALRQAEVEWTELGAVAATRGPGLAAALLMGHAFAKTIAIARQLPFLGINHLEGHLLSPFLDPDAPPIDESPRWLCLVVSGGHTLLARAQPDLTLQLLGRTRDDAAGEAFDKGAKMLGLGYPGGPALEKAAATGDPWAFNFPQGLRHSGDFDFSFSGLKTSLRYTLRDRFPNGATGQDLADLCASYQRAIVEVLASKLQAAIQPGDLATLSGGVACNRSLRSAASKVCELRRARLLLAPPFACTDNAAMIGAVAAMRLNCGHRSPLTEDIDPNLSLATL